MGTHEQCLGATDEWYTPAYIFQAMAVRFDLDVASPGRAAVPWIPVGWHYTNKSLERPWKGFVWMNPPFGGRNGLVPWLEKFVQHGNGVCLVPDRTSAPWWQQFARVMDLAMFVDGKIKFIDRDGKPGGSPAQGTTLWSLGEQGAQALRNAERAGLGFLSTAAKAA